MKGYQITFFTQQDRLHGAVPISQWLIQAAQEHGIRGATVTGALAGLGHDGQAHAPNLFDYSDQPVQVTFVVSRSEAQQIFQHLQKERLQLFYKILPVEFGVLKGDGTGSPEMLQDLTS